MEPDELPRWTYHADRASGRTEAEREQHYQDWLARFGQSYTDAVIEAGYAVVLIRC